MSALCRDCLTEIETARRCPACGGPRLLEHPELDRLAIAHVDCDAFYASVEKRDDPALRDKPVIVGGGRRGVVSAACYIARIHGVRSAMPMFEALRLCPGAVVVRPRGAAYAETSRAIKALMHALTPLVEPLSLDEAFLDLSGTARLHGAAPANLLAGLVRRIEDELGVTASVGLSHNKFLAKLASDMDKPRGFAVIGHGDAADVLRGKPVGLIPGIGTAGRAALERAGVRSIDDLLRWDRRDLSARFGSTGERLYRLARGEDRRRVSPDAPVKSISNETTFASDIDAPDILDGHVWRLAEKVSDRAKAKGLAGRVVTVKLKRADHRLLTRRASLREPSQMAETLYTAAAQLLRDAGAARPRGETGGTGPLRLVGVGLSELSAAAEADRTAGDLVDPQAARRARAEAARDAIRARFGPDAIIKGRALR